MDTVVGVMKAYTTRVGEGPLPTESADIADMLHAMGREFGATTGRARRCGWFDSVATRHAQMVNGISEIAVTNVDGLDSLDVIRVCIGYRVGSTKYDYVPNDIEAFQQCQPIYADFPGWKIPTHKIREWKKLPATCRSYLNAIADLSSAMSKNSRVPNVMLRADQHAEWLAGLARLSSPDHALPLSSKETEHTAR